ncbi:MAG: 4-alpha-glucanotransferase [Planctomycetota bacterium]
MMDLPQRSSGILLHPTSLPGLYGIGTLGVHAYRFVDFLVQSGQSLWQILPLGPVDSDGSPYSSFCSAAGNPLLISLGQLVEHGDLNSSDLSTSPFPPDARFVDYAALDHWKTQILQQAVQRFVQSGSAARKAAFDEFRSRESDWLEDYALFMALKTHYDRQTAGPDHGQATWNRDWDQDIALRQPAALAWWRERLRDRVEYHCVLQYFFFEQWGALKRYANDRGIAIIGDMPIFVALNSVDVWCHPNLFQLDEERREIFVAGVPPDYFSATGQRWGNPLYNWDAMAANGFDWWIRRFDHLLKLVDIVRIDHFRGFAACWAIPSEEEIATNGQWVRVPGYDLFETVQQGLGHLPFLAEDLGVITPDVEELRDHFGFPGMRVLQVGFENIDSENIHLPDNHVENSVVYTGTHDNNTTVGWYQSLPARQQQAIAEFFGGELQDPAWEMIRVAMASVARYAVIPMQDVLRLDQSARMNTPSTKSGNWRWRLQHDHDGQTVSAQLAQLTAEHQRTAQPDGTAPTR